ncbi:G-protein coupled receptor-associated sorting protein 1 [Meriones unguiculatus]|uniref:G-protein coupled receptor-associated sorting protein 1 n=1 Tax=Meriones unguiculatus TaxID=10047 RepID=UPI00293EE2F4|nr:G-protein coupled receptor-associated sorting protein 1 [Meriones unguiculatus]XP_060231504.1 G-protein coupled receptor-associated sorting protein 1 [Meriones unguiculatus]XP_060231505.1 G-protein coupled receptor-associated sorting protein 1 [Meriones unguiculatus]XP_060231506.1 G-protein coupled receptor-associated sorting protein 1 [Meriones unguiculatus]XP_060231507.1 G-protein coupled receptor-associated sorting protein 1 [Meriones unguiculatus]XP_060231508.1 G-protein coupled recepto
MTGAEIEPGAQAKAENKPGAENVNVAEAENEVPMVVRPKVRTQIMTGARPKVKPKSTPCTKPKSETSSPGGAYAKYKPKAMPISRSKNDAQAWAPSKFRADSMSKVGKQCQLSTADSSLVSTDSGVVAQAKCLSVDRELVNMDTESFPKKANSPAGFQPSFGSEEGSNMGSWYRPRPMPKGEAYENSDFKWADKPSGSSSFWNRDESSTRFRPRKSMKSNTRFRHMAKQEANPMPRHKNKQEFYNISSSDTEDESVKTPWFWPKEKTKVWSRPKEEPNNRPWFRPKKEVHVESTSGSECENHSKSLFWSGEEAKSRSKPRARKGVNMRARHQAKREASSDVMYGSVDVSKKESWFLPEDKTNAFSKSKTKKELRTRAVPKEEVKTKTRASIKQARPEEEVLIGPWFWDTQEPTVMGRVSMKPTLYVEEEPFVGDWFWSEEEASVDSGTYHKSRPRAKEQQVNFCLGSGKKTNMENGPKATSKSVPVTNDDEVIVGSWFCTDNEEDVDLQADEESIFGSWFWGSGDNSLRSVRVSCEKMPKSEEKEITDSWFWAGEVSAEAEEQARSASTKGIIFVPWFWSEKQAHMDLGTEPCPDIMAGAEEEPIIGPWFWAKVDNSVEAEADSKSSLEDEEELFTSPWLGAREQPNMNYAAGARCKPLAEAEGANKRSCFWAKEPCFYPTNSKSLKTNLGEKEDTVDSWLWSNNFPRTRASVGSWLWAAEEGNIDDETGEEIKLPTLEDNVFNSWFWEENEETIVNTTKREESRREVEEEDIIGSWFWAGDGDTIQPATRINEDNKKTSEEEDTIGSWFWGKEEASLEAMRRGTCESTPGIKGEKVIGSWFWTEKVKIGAGSQTIETGSETDEEAIFESLIWAAKNGNMDAGVNRVSKPEDEGEMTVKSCLWASDKATEESGTVIISESNPDKEEESGTVIISESNPEKEEESGTVIISESNPEKEEESGTVIISESNPEKEEESGTVIISESNPEKEEESGTVIISESNPEKEEESGTVIISESNPEKEEESGTVIISESNPEKEEESGTVIISESNPEKEEESGTVIISESNPEKEEESGTVIISESNPEKEEESGTVIISESNPEKEEESGTVIISESNPEKEEESGTVIISESNPEKEEGSVAEFGSREKDEVTNKTGTGDNCKLGTETETIVGSWFWEGDEASFEPNPVPVCKAACEPMPSTEQEPDPSRRPQSWDEVTVQFKPGPWGKAGFPSLSSFIFPKEAASLFAEMFGGKPKLGELGPEGEQESSHQSGPEFPFQYDPSYRSVQEIREHLKARESTQPENWSCNCIQCDLRIGSEEFEELLLLMDRNRDPFIHEISKIAMGMRSSSQFTRDFIRNSGVVSLIEALLNYPSSRARTRFLENMVRLAPPYPDLNMIETYVCHICEDTFDSILDSSEQLSGLTMVTHLTATSDYHKVIIDYLAGFFYLLSSGNAKTRFHVLKLLLNLSENVLMTKCLLACGSVSEFMTLFNKEESNDNIQLVFAIFENISNNIQKEELFADDEDDDDVVVNLEPLISAFREAEKLAKELKHKTDNPKSP